MSEHPAPSPTYTVRPNKELLPRLQKLAQEMGRSEALIMADCTSTILDMIEKGYDFVPSLVQKARVLREHFGNNPEKEGLLGGGGSKYRNRDYILPSETVRNLSPDLHIFPVFAQMRKYTLLDPEGPGMGACELVGVPEGKDRGAIYGLKIKAPRFQPFYGCHFTAGDILMMNPLRNFYSDEVKKADPTRVPYWHMKSYGYGIAGFYKQSPFVGRLTTAPKDWGDRHDRFVQVPAGEFNPEPISFPAKECEHLTMVVGVLRVRSDRQSKPTKFSSEPSAS